MKSYIYRFSAVLAMVASMAFSAAPALAGGGYDWTDISDKIAERTNRPVWAMAYASPYWYLTDGQELWSGGHVWRTEGSAMADITTDVRNAGISRVDDIVSDGQTILFLKNVTAKNNTFEVVRLRDSNYLNVTSNLRGSFSSDEGISQILGRMGTWYSLTTKGRMLKLDWNNFSTSQVTLPSAVQDAVSYMNQTGKSLASYNIRLNPNSVNISDKQISILPISGNRWVLLRHYMPTSSINYMDTAASAGYYYDGSTFTEIPEMHWLAAYTERVSSNNENLLFVGRPIYGNERPTGYKIYNTTSKTDITLNQVNGAGKDMLNDYANDTVEFAWDGQRWVILEGKRMLLVEDSNVYELAQTRDYFVTMAGNGNGTIMFGGAVSETGQNGPASPLTAKLVKATSASVTNGGSGTTSGSFGGGKTYSSYSGPNLTTSGNPSDYQVGNGETFVYRAVASDTNGIDRIELYANSARVQTCYSDTCEYSNIYYTNGLSTRAIPFSAKAYDRYGNATESANENLTVDQYGTGNGSTSSNGITLTTTVDLSNNSLYRGSSTVYHVQATANQGLNRIEAYVNGSLKRTCDFSRSYGNQTCDLTVYGSDYTVGQSVNLSAKATDYNGQTAWSDTKYLTITDNASNSGNGAISGQTGNTYFWTWTEPNNATVVKRGEILTFNVGANDADGLKSIIIYVNGNQKRTCDYSRAYGNQTCSLTIYGNDYSVSQQLAVNAKITDYNNAEAWPTMQYLTVQDSSYSGNTTGDVSAWNWFEPSSSSLNRGSSTTFKVQANATQGLQRIEVYADGSLKRTCDFSRAYSTQSCDLSVNGSDYSIAQHSFNAKATDYFGKTAWSDSKTITVQDNGSASGDVSTWTWLDPSNATLNRNSNSTFRVQATANQGLNSIEVFINGNLKRTCSFSRSYGTQNCDLTVYGTDYPNGSVLSLNAKATDYNGKTTWSDNKSLTIQDSGSSGNGNTVYSLSPSDRDLKTNENFTFTVNASDSDGLNRIDIYINDNKVQTCNYSYASGNRECTHQIYGSNYSAGSNLYVYAKVTDSSNNTIQTNNRNYRVVSSGSSNGGTGDYPATWSWSNPERSQITTSESAVYHVGAWDNDGLNRIEIYVNGILAHNCNFGTSVAYGNQECQFTLNGGNFKNGDQVYVNAKAVDAGYRESWAAARTYGIVSGTGSDSNHSSWIWSDPNVSEIYGSQNVTFYVGAWAQNGVRKIEIIGNGSVMKTCDLGFSAYGNQQCSVAVGTTSGSYYGRITDGYGSTYNSESKSFTVVNAPTPTTNDIGGTVSMTSDRDGGYGASDTIKFSAAGQDSDGIDRLELMVNGRLVKVCYTGSCSWTGGPYADRTSVTYGARLVDSKGRAYFTGYKTIYKK